MERNSRKTNHVGGTRTKSWTSPRSKKKKKEKKRRKRLEWRATRGDSRVIHRGGMTREFIRRLRRFREVPIQRPRRRRRLTMLHAARTNVSHSRKCAPLLSRRGARTPGFFLLRLKLYTLIWKGRNKLAVASPRRIYWAPGLG